MNNNDNYQVVSNHMGPDGESIDRLYGSPASGGHMRLINRDYSEYKGGIQKRAINCKNPDGTKFRSYVHLTDDNRWFDRSGMPIDKPTNLVTQNENKKEEENKEESSIVETSE